MLEVIKTKTNIIPNLSNIRKLREKQSETKTLPISRYNFNLVSSNFQSSFNVKVKSYEDYKKIKEGMKFTMLTEDDLKWIDEHVYENEKVIA